MVTYGSNKVVWWKGKCGHEWQMSVKSRTMGQGCPYCAGVKVLVGYNDIVSARSELAEEWSDKNEDLLPTDFTAGSSKKVWWKGKCGHEWQAIIKNRVNGAGCPYCSNNKIKIGENDLAHVRPDLAIDWSAKNGTLKPKMVTQYSNQKVWWKCHVCGYEWQSLISSRSRGVQCLCCSGYITVAGKNDLQTTHSELVKEWSDLNDSGLHEYQASSREYVWWKCKDCGFEWKATIHNRVNGRSSCPRCRNEKRVEQALIRQKQLSDMRKFRRRKREEIIQYYIEKAGYEIAEQDDSVFGILLELYVQKLKTAFIVSKPYHDSVNGRRREYAKNELCRKNNIQVIRFLERNYLLFDNCVCIRCADNSSEKFDQALLIAFEMLGINVDVDSDRDMAEIYARYQEKIELL